MHKCNVNCELWYVTMFLLIEKLNFQALTSFFFSFLDTNRVLSRQPGLRDDDEGLGAVKTDEDTQRIPAKRNHNKEMIRKCTKTIKRLENLAREGSETFIVYQKVPLEEK